MKKISMTMGLAFLLMGWGNPLLAKDTGDKEDIFDLPLEELLNIEITGASVRDLNLDRVSEADNPFQLKIKDIPAAVEVIDSKTMEARGLKNVVEATQSLSGVLTGESPSEPYSFSMRGYNRDSVNVLYDGISMGRSTLNMRPLSTFNLERVEVIKGASTLIGTQGNAGGTVNIVNKKAKLTKHFHNKTIVAYGNYGNNFLNVESNGPITDKAAYHINASHTGSDGWVDDTDSDTIDLNLSTLWKVNDKLKIYLSFNYLKDELPAYWGTPLLPAGAARNVNRDVVTTNDGRVIDEDTRFTNYNVTDNEIESEGMWKRIDIKWRPSESFQSNLIVYHYGAKRKWRNAESYTYDSGTGRIGRDRLSIKHDRNVYGARNNSTYEGTLFGHKNQVSATLEYQKNEFDRETGIDTAAGTYTDLVDIRNPVRGVFGNVSTRTGSFYNDTLALTLQERFVFSEDWSVEASWKHELLGINRTRYNFNGSVRSGTLKNRFNVDSYRLGSVYALNDNINAYINVTHTYGLLEGDIALGLNTNINTFRPSDILQKEIGFKGGVLDNTFQFTLALFRIDKDLPTHVTNVSYQESQHDSQGLEFSFDGRLSPDFRLGGSFSYVDAEYGNYYDGIDSTNDVSGKTPFNVPKVMAGLWSSYNGLFSLPIEVGASVNHVAKRFANNSDTTTLKPYTLFDVFAAYNLKKYRIGLHLRNITDEIYAPWSDIFYQNQVILGPPRTIEGTFQATF